MKNIKLLFFLLLTITLTNNKVSAQAYIYHPMVVDSATWEYSDIKDNNVYCDWSNRRLIYGDTIVDAKLYKKLRTPGNGSFDLIREDNKKIYYRRDFGTFFRPELLLYDFSKDLGDTILTNRYNAQGSIDTLKSKIIKIDSILTQKGYRKRFKIDAINYGWAASCDMIERFWFIEEIGSPISFVYIDLAGIGASGPCEGSSYIIKKTTFNDTLVIPPVGCLHLSVGSLEDSANKIILTTNDSSLSIKLNFIPNGVFELFDLFGKKVYSLNLKHQKEYTLDSIILNRAIYVWKYYDFNQKKHLSGKFSFN